MPHLAATGGIPPPTRPQVWRTPALAKDFAPFVLHRTLAGPFDTLSAVAWSPDGLWLLAGGADLTGRVFSLNPVPGFEPPTLAGHRDRLVGAFFRGRACPSFAQPSASHAPSPPNAAAVTGWLLMERQCSGANPGIECSANTPVLKPATSREPPPPPPPPTCCAQHVSFAPACW